MRIALSALLLLALVGCETVATTQPGAVGVTRQQTMMVSSAEVNQAAAGEYGKVLADARRKGVLDRNASHVQRVRTIATRLIPHTAAFRPDAPGWAWETHVIQDNQLNAWAMPGGKMVVYSGLIEKLRLTDDELAAIMGHEIAHSLREHARERVSREMATGLGVGIVGAVLGLGETGQQLAGAVANVTFNLPHSRSHEIEADRIGVELAARAGFNPHAAVSLWQKMLQASGSSGPQFLSTHPSPENRLQDLQTYADRVMPLYQQARR
ncbi:MAG TPA: M48 family metallopeptidase [Burkholderiales bacterium]|nr:M48 family metallopeptidase [Burkholderiales bacterium]